MAPKQPVLKYEYLAAAGRIVPVTEPECKDEESPVDYNAGGYLPVKLNDTFKLGRYRVIRKLGWGHFSTVWLVKDAELNCHSALKVVKSAGRYAETARDEIKLLNRVSAASPTHPGRPHIVSFLDSFAHEGPEASHICIVFEPLGENLLALIERHKKKGVPRPLVKVIAKQALLGLQYLHEECDLVHTDIKPENILISIPDIEAHIHTELSYSPSPTSRRVGVPLPSSKSSRAGLSIPPRPTRRQVQIFDSQPLASPGRSQASPAYNQSSLAGSGSSSGNSSYVAQMHLARFGGTLGHANGSVASLSSSAPKLGASHLSNSISRSTLSKASEPPAKSAIHLSSDGASGGVQQSPSTSSSSSSISSTLGLGGVVPISSSIVSTPPTSLSHSLGSAAAGLLGAKMAMAKGIQKEDEQIKVEVVCADDKVKHVSVPVPVKINKGKGKAVIEGDLDSAISASWKDRLGASLKDRISSSWKSNLSSPHSARRSRESTGSRLSISWKDPGAAALAPALVVSASVGADGEEGAVDYVRLSAPSVSSKTTSSGSSSATVTQGEVTPQKKLRNSVPSRTSPLGQSNLNAVLATANATINTSPSATPSLLTQTAPPKRCNDRVSPSHHISQLSAHVHSDSSSFLDCCPPRIHNQPDVLLASTSPTSLTPTPTSPVPTCPPPSPSNEPESPRVLSRGLPSLTAPVLVPRPPALHTIASPIETSTSTARSQPISIKIADLGNATPSTKHYTEDIQTRQYRAPEAILGRKDWGARVDIWSIACVIFELLTAEYLFDPQGQGELFTKDDDHMAQIIELLGDFSMDVKMGGKYSRELFDHTGALRYIRTLKPWPLKRVMMEKYLHTEQDAAALCAFLEPMLVVDMRIRSEAREMIGHPWLEMKEGDEFAGEW